MLPLTNFKISYREQIGAGSFGSVYLAEDPAGSLIAVKKEPITLRCPQLLNELTVYNEIKGGVGIADIKCHGTQGKFNILVMEYLGQSLQNVFNLRTFNLKTVLMLANQLLSRIEYLHNHNYVHRDIKPDNFLIGRRKSESTIYMIDFGLSKLYRDPNTKKHIPISNGKSLTGSTRFASLNNHRGFEYSRRDDIESIAYVLIYFMKGNLPWQGIEANDQESWNEKVYQKKKSVTVKELTDGIPMEFGSFLISARSLAFEEEPKYAEYRAMFNELLLKSELFFDGQFCWMRNRAQSSVQKNNQRKINQASSVQPLSRVSISKYGMQVKNSNQSFHNKPGNIIKPNMPKAVIQIHTKRTNIWK